MMTEQSLYDEILTSKDLDPSLSTLTSNSATAIWKNLCRFFAQQAFSFWQRLEVAQAELLTIVDTRQAGTIEWYRTQILHWQRGYEMRFVNGVYQYEAIDATAQIVAKCAIEETRNALLIKVARLENGFLKPLETNDLSNLRAYASKVKFAGTRLAIVSHRADMILGSVTIYFNPELNGSMVSERCKIAISEMLNRHEFNGRLRLSAIMDTLQGVRGVIDVVNLQIQVVSTNGVANITREHIAKSGYFELSNTFIVNHEPYL